MVYVGGDLKKMPIGNSTGVLDAFLDAFLLCAVTECLGPGLNV